MIKIIEYEFNGYKATVIRPNIPNNKWIWKTEFLYAFDKAESELVNIGYTRVYYQISDMYGCPNAIKLMREFYLDIVKRFSLEEKCVLFGFSRGGLYAFNYAMSYPNTVEKVYLDAPVLDLWTWPPKGSKEYYDMLSCYNLNEKSFESFSEMPINSLCEYFNLGIPLMLIAGDSDQVVDFNLNSKKVIDYCNANNIPLKYIVKKGCKHHPHSLEDVTPIIDFVCNRGE
jgi:pimeloyl-ACP methyl ester carboxylesterase